ncbi:MAG: hypothetical protein ACJ0GY_11520 [Synechococcus sp.]
MAKIPRSGGASQLSRLEHDQIGRPRRPHLFKDLLLAEDRSAKPGGTRPIASRLKLVIQ